jgi:hypothetical protein
MSTTAIPLPSQFVCGTSSSADVYYLSAGIRRLVPDAQTVAFLLAGQTVRILSAAEMAAIPLGTPMPTRKDGSLLTQKYTAPPPGITLYFMTAGQRRRVPDVQTQIILSQEGLPFLQVEAEDLTAIPEGSALPTRMDGTLYKGPGKPFAYIMQGGSKLAFPDAATLRDRGFDFKILLPIAASDLSFIPDGAPYATSGHFLSPPASNVPLVLLPVRLETRIQNVSGTIELWLRVYPDDIHVDSFEPQLTADEMAARTSYLALASADADTREAAFAALVGQFGTARTAWMTSPKVPAGIKQADWSIAPYTNVLPERWIVMGYQGDGAGQLLATGNVIADSLPLGPSLDDKGHIKSDDTKWVSDFQTAIDAGMAFRIPLTPAQTRGFKRIAVLGLKTGLGAADSAARFAALLQAHHYTDGLELLPNNTPTNNTEDVPSGLASKDPGASKLFALEQGPALCPARPTADGDRLSRALGVAPETFAHVSGADGAQDEQAGAMNTVLWPATWGYYLGQIVAGAVPNASVMLLAARAHSASHVRARGHFPAMRIGKQPYGILPVCWNEKWLPLEGQPLDAPLHGLLAQLRTIWRKYIPLVPRIPNAPDPEAALVDVLAMTPSTFSTDARNVLGPEYAFAYWNFVNNNLAGPWWTNLAQRVQSDGIPLAAAMAQTRLAHATYLSWHHALSDIIVDLDNPDAARNYINTLKQMGWLALEKEIASTDPVPMLYLLLRYAATREYLDTAADLLTAANPAQAGQHVEAELVGFAGTSPRPTAWAILGSTLGSGTVGDRLDTSKADPSLPSFAAFWKALAQLAQYPATDLDAATREGFDLASYRLDAWVSSFAHYRLDQTRAANPNGGIVLGAYGWVENVGTWPDQPATAGYVHAPSLNQSTTAAILRSGYLTHEGGSSRPFAIDLSSARVRLALHLLDGIREGQSLGALLGYRLERTLQDMAPKEPGLYDLIDKLRAIAPMDGAGDLDVVDGLSLFRMAVNAQVRASWSVGFSTTLQSALTAGLTMLGDALDSVADLTLAESVHQLIRGNTLRAGTAVDNIARGDAPPPEIDFIKTPRSGTALTYRLMTAAIGDSAPGWATTPRAQAEPRLNAWAAALLGNPSSVRIRARWVGVGGSNLLDVEIGLDQLALAPMDLLALPETQGIAGEFANRIVRVVAQARPGTVPAEASVQILEDRDPAWPSQTIGLAEWLGLLNAITRVTGAARALQPADLVVQDDTPGAVNTDDLHTRAETAKAQLVSALAALHSPSAGDAALLNAAALGVAGAFPSLDASAWPTQIAAAIAELITRSAALARLESDFAEVTAKFNSQADKDSMELKAYADLLRDEEVSRLKAIFGSSFIALPAFDASTAAGWPKLWANSQAIQGGDTLASIRWMQQAARVRDGVGYLDTALMFAEAFAGRTLLQLDVAQLPTVDNDRWVALDSPKAPSANTLSLVAFSPTPYLAGSAVAGLMVDEWTDVWPSKSQTTGVTFQYTDPIARAPQAVLLAVAPDDFPEWTLESVEGSVLEALELAKLRGADPDVLFGEAPPTQIDNNVKAFQAISDSEVFVLRTDGSLWLRHAPFDAVPAVEEQVDASVSAFEAISDLEVVVLGTDGRLWLEHGPFGNVPPARQQIDAGQPTLPPPTIVIQPPPTTVVPDVSNPADDISPTLAQKMLTSAGLKYIGTGVLQPPCKAYHQSVQAGSVVPLGTPVTVSFEKAPVNRQ